MVNDQITEVDGRSLAGISNQEAVEILKNTGGIVHLTIIRYLRGLKFEELQDGIKQADTATPTSPYPQTPAGATPSGPPPPDQPQQQPQHAQLPSNSTTVTTSSLSGPSSSLPSNRHTPLSSCSSTGVGGALTLRASSPLEGVAVSKKPMKSRSSPMSRSLKHTNNNNASEAAAAEDAASGSGGRRSSSTRNRRSVPNILDDCVVDSPGTWNMLAG